MKKESHRRRNILVICDSDYSSSRRVAAGVLMELSEHPDWSTTTLNHRNAGFLQSVRLLNRGTAFDGVISDTSIPLTDELVAALPQAHIVSATADLESHSKDWPAIDNKAIANAAADALLRLGCRSFAYVGTEDTAFRRFHSSERARHFGRALQTAGASATALLIDDPQLERFLTDLPKPAGIFAFNDRTAAALLKTIVALGIDVPGQIAVIGVDNDPDICNYTHPSLSSIDPDFESAGSLAVKLLAHAFSGRKFRSKRVFGVRSVVHRESTTSYKTGGRTIASAREIIRLKYAKRLTLGSIAQELHVSPRLLSLRFREITGHTVHDEIAQTRLEAAKALLQKSSEPVKAIAAACGYPTLQNFYRHFRRRYGVPPTKRVRPH